MNTWLAQHLAALRDALRRLAASPLNTLLSLLVIGIALTLPTAGWVVLDNLRAITHSASSVQQISIFMTLDASKRDIGEIESRLRNGKPGTWRFIAKDEALKRPLPVGRKSRTCNSIQAGSSALMLSCASENWS
jgi:cell division transport system permease protein